PWCYQKHVQVVEASLKQSKCAFNGSRGRHVNACGSKSFERKFRATRTQEIKIGFHGSRFTGKHALRKRNGGRNPSRIFIDIERVIDIRYAQALQIEFVF